MAHTCHAVGCNAKVPPEMLMCRRHWFMVPQKLRNAAWGTYRTGQCDDWRPSAEYCDAAKAAVLAVAEKEGLTVASDDPKVTLYDMFKRAATA
jgi:hypothetical protein